MVVNVTITVFSDVHGLVNRYQHIRRIRFISHQGMKIEAGGSSEMSVATYKTIRCHFPEDYVEVSAFTPTV
jgi:hypothetical protein